ncbi:MULTISPECIES: acyltransferase family protein [Flavobacterium]|uniref:Acyltransferase 3 domain-containing protein n=1 Tax=Flavobacterium hankyongi TaxID=1176532 RepID=A0ABP8ZY78_9FLAO|nr:acyltransferase [Flavobacterium sp. N1846]
MIKKEKFETFDALRFFSFLLVFIFHLPPDLRPLETRGDIGVWFFFSLSGFLITYLLLIEKKNYSKINFKKYFIRRSLRIWPLYFIALGLALAYHIVYNMYGSGNLLDNYEQNWILSVLFLENYRVMYFNSFSNLPIVPVLWSLCVEEHFYILWGLILNYTKIKNLPFWIISLIIISYIFKQVYFIYNIRLVDILSNLDFFMYGAIPAYLYVNYKDQTTIIINKISLIVKLIICLGCISYTLGTSYFSFNHINIIEPLILGLFFSSIILIMLPKNNKLKISEENILSKMGTYTYGLYIYHSIVILVLYFLLTKNSIKMEKTILSIIIFTLSLTITLLISKLSYKLIELPFIKLKKRFET